MLTVGDLCYHASALGCPEEVYQVMGFVDWGEYPVMLFRLSDEVVFYFPRKDVVQLSSKSRGGV